MSQENEKEHWMQLKQEELEKKLKEKQEEAQLAIEERDLQKMAALSQQDTEKDHLNQIIQQLKEVSKDRYLILVT